MSKALAMFNPFNENFSFRKPVFIYSYLTFLFIFEPETFSRRKTQILTGGSPSFIVVAAHPLQTIDKICVTGKNVEIK
jgi:hypothetical protein